MARHENKICPRCGVEFECKVGSVLLCQCAGVVLNESRRESITARYEDCLCVACLRDLGREGEEDLRHA